MEIEEFEIRESTEGSGEMNVRVSSDEEAYELVFSYVKRCFGPHEHSPFPTGDKKIYAWPKESIPKELKAEEGSDEALHRHIVGVDSQLPDDIHFLSTEYSECENVNKSPFVEY